MGGTEVGAPAAGEEGISLAALLKYMAQAIFLSDVAQHINDVVYQWRQEWAMRTWEKRGRPLPPPHPVKQMTVKAYARAFSIGTMVETGTYLGAMIRATRGTFRRIISIELDPHLFKRARRKLAEPGRISIVNGDSAEVLPRILAGLHEPCLFWLDAHHSGVLTARGRLESPILLEMQHILTAPCQGHVVLVDDAHEFVGQGGYPTIPELRTFVAKHRPDWVVEVEDDIIRLHARSPEARRGTARR